MIYRLRIFYTILNRLILIEVKQCKRIPLKYINVMFKNFEYFASISFTHSKRFDPNVFGMNLDGDIITAESRNPFKSKYCYRLAVNIKRKYFTIVRIVHYKNNMCYNDYLAKI